jgi:hypothetical protein
MAKVASINDAELIGGAVVVLGLLFWLISKQSNAAAVGSAVGSTAAGVVTGAAAGVVTGVGSAVGIPVTNSSQCAQDQAAGNTWAASFSCSASNFLGWLFGSGGGGASSASSVSGSASDPLSSASTTTLDPNAAAVGTLGNAYTIPTDFGVTGTGQGW